MKIFVLITTIFLSVLILFAITFIQSSGTCWLPSARLPNPPQPTIGCFYFSSQTTAPPPDENVIWNQVQSWRAQNRLTTYKESELLCKYSELRLNDMSAGFNHDNFIASRSDQIYSENPNFSHLGENLSENFVEPLEKWLESPTHKKNLVEPFEYSCLRCKNNYCVQLFAR